MAESIQRILKRRALAGHHPQTPEQMIAWLAAARPRLESDADSRCLGRGAPCTSGASPAARPCGRMSRGTSPPSTHTAPSSMRHAISDATDPLLGCPCAGGGLDPPSLCLEHIPGEEDDEVEGREV